MRKHFLIDLNKTKMTELEQIELILVEASAFGLRQEVERTADDYQKRYPNVSRLVTITWAFSEWVK
jgi:hypothetical protein